MRIMSTRAAKRTAERMIKEHHSVGYDEFVKLIEEKQANLEHGKMIRNTAKKQKKWSR